MVEIFKNNPFYCRDRGYKLYPASASTGEYKRI